MSSNTAQSLGFEEGEPAAKRPRLESEATSGGGSSSAAPHQPPRPLPLPQRRPLRSSQSQRPPAEQLPLPLESPARSGGTTQGRG